MSGYTRADYILPQEVLELIQKYVDGTYLYIPRREDNRREWGESNKAKLETAGRNREIYLKYREGTAAAALADEYFLSVKSIQRIVLAEKRKVS